MVLSEVCGKGIEDGDMERVRTSLMVEGREIS